MKTKPLRIIWFRPDFDGAAMHGFRKTGDGVGKGGESVRIYTSLCGAVVLHQGDRLSGSSVSEVVRIYDHGICSQCQRKRLEEP
jgi:hypothetical protein